MKLSAIVSLLIAANASKEMILEAIVAWEKSTEDAHSIARDKANARWQKWKDEKDGKLQTNVEGMPPTYTNNSRAGVTRVEDNPSKKDLAEQKERKEVRSPSGSRLPKDFVPEPGIASGLGLTRREFEDQFAQFKDYWTAKAGKDARKADWQATWRNWCRRAVKDRRARAGPQTTIEKGEEWYAETYSKDDDHGSENDVRPNGPVERISSKQGEGHEGRVVSIRRPIPGRGH